MSHTFYRFRKDGHVYSVNGNNVSDAKLNAELRFGISLSGAAFEEVYNLKTVRKGVVRECGGGSDGGHCKDGKRQGKGTIAERLRANQKRIEAEKIQNAPEQPAGKEDWMEWR